MTQPTPQKKPPDLWKNRKRMAWYAFIMVNFLIVFITGDVIWDGDSTPAEVEAESARWQAVSPLLMVLVGVLVTIINTYIIGVAWHHKNEMAAGREMS